MLKSAYHLLIFSLIVVCGTTFSCVTPDDDNLPQEPTANEIKPNANDIIEEEIIAPFEVKNSRINLFIGSADDNYIFGGTLNSEPAIVKTDRMGNVLWSVETSFQCNGLKLVPGDTDKVIGIGAIDSDDNGSFDKGGFIVIDKDGNVIQELDISSDDGVWFNGLDAYLKDDKLNIIIAGAITRNTIFFPYVNKLVLDNADVQLETSDFENPTIFEDKSSSIMLNVKYALEGSTDKFYYTMNSFTSDGFPFKMEIGKLSNSFDNTDWSEDLISADGTKIFGEPIENLRISGGRVYVIASQEDAQIGSGINFLGGLIVSIDKDDGTILWGERADFSEFTDQIKAFAILDDEIYISGLMASFNTTSRAFSYGFLAKASLSDGIVTKIKTFGSDELSSRFGALRFEDDNIIGAGSTNFSTGTTFDYWIVKMKLSEL